MEKLPGIRFSSFAGALPSENITRSLSLSKWELAEYNTTFGGGTMLMCRPGALPPPVVVSPKLSGWHRIHVCLWDTAMPSASISLRLTDDLGASFFCRSVRNEKYPTWSYGEVAEEYYWKCADMTGQDVTITKLQDKPIGAVGIFWLRFEPMSEAEVAAYKEDAARRDVKILHAHTDLDWLGRMDTVSESLFAPFVDTMASSDAELLSVEFYPLLQDYSFMEKVEADGAISMLGSRQLFFRKFVKSKEAVYKYLTEQCHAHGMRVHAALRQSNGVMPIPSDIGGLGHRKFADEHPEFFCVDRDGEPFSSLSFAFTEVQDYIIGEYLKMLPYGFDGITMFFHRGVMTAFEAPVIELCEKLYPGVDARLLPLEDPRLQRVHSEILTAYVRRMREALDAYSERNGKKRLHITVIGYYSVDDNLLSGIDVERWAAEGLIDEFITANMRVYEENSRITADGNPNLIDMAKYRREKYEAPMSPVMRFFLCDLDRMVAAVPKLQEISKRTGLAVYYEMPWECTYPPEYMREYAMKLYDAGAEHISLWDAFHTRVMNRAEWNLVSRLGHRAELKDMPSDRDGYGRSCRVLSLNGVSIATYHPAWNG